MSSKWPSSITIIRHGESERNVAQAIAKAKGSKASWECATRDQDTPLTALGTMQATNTGLELQRRCKEGNFSYSTIFTSPYLRTKQTTAQILKIVQNPKVVIEERIREIEFGQLDSLSVDGIRAKYPEEVARRAKEGKYWYRPPGGESRPDVALRVHSFIDALIRDYANEHVVIVCHSVVVLIFRRLFERWTEEEYIKVDKEDDVKNCSITVYYPDELGKIKLSEYNNIFYPIEKISSNSIV